MKQSFLYMLLIIVVFLFSCEKMIETGASRTQLTADKAFADEQTTLAVLVTIYSTINSSVASNITPFMGLYSDELVTNSSNTGTIEFYNSHLSVGNTPNHNIWRSLYNVIYQCNSLLEALEINQTIPAAVKQQFKGEVLFLRSFAYSFLVQLYDDVPLLLVTDVRITSVSARTAKSTIYTQLIADLELSKQLLKPGYVSAERVRANRWAAEALLARLYIQQGIWEQAENSCTAIISSGEYLLSTSLANVFIKNNPESILQCWTQNGFTQTGTVLIPSGTNVPTYQVSSSLLNRFEAGDQRKSSWVRSIVNNGSTYYHVYKYKHRVSTSGTNSEYLMIFRLGEIYLLRAEARAKQSKYSEALADVNLIRQRAGLASVNVLQPNAVYAAIAQEQFIELFTEWGNRFFDLKRKAQTDAVFQPLKPNWDNRRTALPIPQYELLNNSSLTQNPGY